MNYCLLSQGITDAEYLKLKKNGEEVHYICVMCQKHREKNLELPVVIVTHNVKNNYYFILFDY